MKQIEYNKCVTHFSTMVFKCFRNSGYPISSCSSIQDNMATSEMELRLYGIVYTSVIATSTSAINVTGPEKTGLIYIKYTY